MLAVTACLLALATTVSDAGATATAALTNPVAPHGQDPWVMLHGGVYYYCYSHRGAVWVNSDAKLDAALQRRGKVVWRPEPGKAWSQGLWAPELNHLNGGWYIYVTADDGRNENHRMWVLESPEPDGAFTLAGKASCPEDRWAIDGTVLDHGGKLYFIWSGWEGAENVAQNLYIALMESPTATTGPRVLISRPEHPWERVGRPVVNEGPTALKNAGKTLVIYSASGSWTDDYCMGMLTLTGSDPMDPNSWVKHPAPVFASANGVHGPGHASFVKSQDGLTDWIVYHAARRKGSGWDRDIRMQPFKWNKDGTPDFGQPLAPGVPIPLAAP